MRNPTTRLFEAVRRRLLLLRLATALRSATWAAAAILAALTLVHLFVARLDVTTVFAAAALPWLVAAGWIASQRIPPEQCAAWADRHLEGKSAYATLLETVGDQPATPASPAVERLLLWLEVAAPRSEAMLQARPLQMRLAKPVMAMCVSAALAAILLQIPTQDTASRLSTSAAPSMSQAELAAGVTTEPGKPPATGGTAATAAARGNRGPAREAPTGAELAAATNAGEDSGQKALPSSTAPATGASGSRAASGGREAGDSADTLEDTGFSTAWQGELARQLLTAAAPADSAPTRADPARAGDYAAAPGPLDDPSAMARIVAAPAVSPEARPRVPVGPAEQAYIRAYFSGSGASQ